MSNGPYDTTTGTSPYTDAPQIFDELSHTTTTYGEPYQKMFGLLTSYTYRIKTVTTAYRYRLCYMTATHAAAVIALLEADYAAEGAALDPARAVAAVTGEIGYSGLAYDVVVNYANAVQTEEEVI